MTKIDHEKLKGIEKGRRRIIESHSETGNPLDLIKVISESSRARGILNDKYERGLALKKFVPLSKNADGLFRKHAVALAPDEQDRLSRYLLFNSEASPEQLWEAAKFLEYIVPKLQRHAESWGRRNREEQLIRRELRTLAASLNRVDTADLTEHQWSMLGEKDGWDEALAAMRAGNLLTQEHRERIGRKSSLQLLRGLLESIPEGKGGKRKISPILKSYFRRGLSPSPDDGHP